ncbi:DUF4132 domain-containing protein, partial [Actinacidiphila bryophytorum]
MGWWRRLLRRGGRGPARTGPAPTPLEDAGRRDARAHRGRLTDGTDPEAVRAPHSSAVVAALPAAERRRLALELQGRRRRLACTDDDWWAAKALASTHCGWSPPEVAELLRLAVTEPSGRTATSWGRGAERALQLPLAALAQLPADARGPLLDPVRTALTLTAAHHGTGMAHPGRERATIRLRAVLGAHPDLTTLLPPGDPYATAARCGLGPRLYDPGVVELLRLCRQPLDVRPGYRWLGTVREHLEQSKTAARALPALLAAARPRPDDCPDHRAHLGTPNEASVRLLGALAWAACLSGRHKALVELGAALRHHGDADGMSHFLRSGLAALGALGGEPGTGEHRRVISGHPAQTERLAAEQLDAVRGFPAGWDSTALRHPVGTHTAVFTVHPDGKVTLGFRTPNGRLRHDVPAQVRRLHPVQYAALRAQLGHLRRQVTTHVGALSERLHADPGIPAARWAADYLDVPALERLTRALVWQADLPRGPVTGLPAKRRRGTVWVLRDLHGAHHELADTTRMSLWDPRHA